MKTARIRLIQPGPKPATKLERAVAYLRSRGLYALDAKAQPPRVFDEPHILRRKTWPAEKR